MGRSAAKTRRLGVRGGTEAVRKNKLETYEEAAVEGLAALALDGVVGCAALCGVGAAGGLALRWSIGRGVGVGAVAVRVGGCADGR